MTKDNIAQKMFKGSSFMFARMMVSQVASLLSYIFLSRILSPDEWGIYVLAGFIVALFGILTFVLSPGIDIFTARQIARYTSVKEMAKTRTFMTFAIKYRVLICTLAFVVAFFLSDILSLFYAGSLIGIFVRILSITLITGGLYSFVSFIFQGFNRFDYVLGFVSLQEISFVLLLFILFVKQGNLMLLIIGQVITQTIVVLVGLVLFLKYLPAKTNSEEIPWKYQLRELFKFGTPLIGVDVIRNIRESLKRIIISIVGFYDTVAYYNVSLNAFTSVRDISGLLTRPLLPVLSELDSKRAYNRIEVTMNHMMRYLTISACLISGIFVFSMDFIFRLILTEPYFWLVPYVKLMMIIGIFGTLGGIFSYWLYASGRTKIFPILDLINISYSLPLFFIAFWYFGLFGGLMWSIIASDLLFIYIWIYVKKYSGINVSYKTFIYPFILFLIVIGIVTFLVPFTILQIFSFFSIYSLLIILTKRLTKKDLVILRQLNTGSTKLNAFFVRIINKLSKILAE
ncbi:MAG: lipopolysaccharide biosynthesis protein [Promethearchaeota archaeon]